MHVAEKPNPFGFSDFPRHNSRALDKLVLVRQAYWRAIDLSIPNTLA
jgi:hypothetical protein